MAQNNSKKVKSEAGDAMEKIFPMIFAALAAVLVVVVVVGLSLALNS